jgi:hypothetical protein
MALPACQCQRTLWQAFKNSGRRLLPSCCLSSRCEEDEDVPLPLKLQQQQETSCAGCRSHCRVPCVSAQPAATAKPV